jgi:two-component system, LytTR family, response regulator
MKRIRALVVDDKPDARAALAGLLGGQPDIDVVGQAECGESAVAAIREHKPDLVFLNVEMPGRTGFEVLDELGDDTPRSVVFVTAAERYAVPAFDANAVDFLLKPYSYERFEAALQRARDALRPREAPPAGEALARFTVKAGEMLKVFRVDEIDWIEADKMYVRLHIGGKAFMIRQTMGALERRLPGDRFARIHRSIIVNLDRVVALEPLFQGDYTVMLKDGTELRMSRRRRDALAGRVEHLS